MSLAFALSQRPCPGEGSEDEAGQTPMLPASGAAHQVWQFQTARRPYLTIFSAMALLLAASAVLTWLNRAGPLPAGAGAADEDISLDEEKANHFLPTSYGSRGCPSGTITVPTSKLCREFAASVREKGPCAHSHGYGKDCDGPEDGRAPWCSSRPLGCWQSRNGCSYFKESGTDEPQGDVRPVCKVVGSVPPAPDSLYCFSVLANTVDHELLRMQRKEGLGVFACDGHSVYSEKEIELSPGGSMTIAIHRQLSYLEVWKHVLSSGRFRDFAWTLKASADAAFLPSRARERLRGLWDPPRGIYVANCEHEGDIGFNGALETFSRNALEKYARDSRLCTQGQGKLQKESRSEARFMDECMARLGVFRRQDSHFMLGPRCHARGEVVNSVNMDCSRGKYVAFYPFRQHQAYQNCVRAAEAAP